MLWQHITSMFYQDLLSGLKLLPRLTYEHINLTAYSVMRVNLAAQVLSASVAAVLKDLGLQKQQQQQSSVKWWIISLTASTFEAPLSTKESANPSLHLTHPIWMKGK